MQAADHRSMSPRALFACVLLAGVVVTALGGCGDDDLPAGVAAEVRGRSITEKAIDHAVIGRIAIGTSSKSPPAYWPADIEGCVEAARRESVDGPSRTEAEAACKRAHARHRIAALRLLIHGEWYQLEARRRGLRLPSAAAGARAASMHAGVTQADMRDVARAFDASDLLLLQDPPPAATFTSAEIARYYERHRELYAPPPLRLAQALIMPTRREAQAVLTQFDRGLAWAVVVRRYGRQGVRPSMSGLVSTSTMQDVTLRDAVDERGPGEGGIVKVARGWYVFRVLRVLSSAEQSSLEEVTGQIRYDLTTRYNRRMRNRFNARLGETYRADTVCAERYRLPDCS